MRPCLYVKTGVKFDRIAPAGFHILWALGQTARVIKRPLTITCGTEDHPPTDPHSTGEAYDVRSRMIPAADQQRIVREMLLALSDGPDDAPVETSGGLATKYFFGFLESPGTPHAHFHFQRRNGRIFP